MFECCVQMLKVCLPSGCGCLCEFSAVISDHSSTISEGISWKENCLHGINYCISHIFPCFLIFLPLRAMQINKQTKSVYSWFALEIRERQSEALYI